MRRFEVGRHLIIDGWAYEITATDGEALELTDLVGDVAYDVPIQRDGDGEYLLATDGERIRPMR